MFWWLYWRWIIPLVSPLSLSVGSGFCRPAEWLILSVWMRLTQPYCDRASWERLMII